jgi:hypothetical protein
VAGQAGLSFPSTVAFDVVERAPGGPATAFAAPECRRPFPQVTAGAERAKVTPAAARRLAGLVTAAWATFDEVAAASPAGLRKGPRGGGRDRDPLIEHVIGAETAYARKLGVKLKQPAIDDTAAIQELREAIAAVIGAPSDGSPVVPDGWTTRYAARRIARLSAIALAHTFSRDSRPGLRCAVHGSTSERDCTGRHCCVERSSRKSDICPERGSRPRSGVNETTGVGSPSRATNSSKERTYTRACSSIAYRPYPPPHR